MPLVDVAHFLRNAGPQLRQVVRRLARARLFTIITLVTLAVAVGANATIFSVLEGVLLKPLPYPQPEALIGIWHTAPGIGLKTLNMAPSLYFIDREQNRTLTDLGMYRGDSVDVTGAAKPEHLRGLDVTDGTLPLLGVSPAVGRLFSRQDDLPSSPETLLISYAYWRSHYGSSPSVVGRTLHADGKPRTIIGVLPKNFHFLDMEDAAVVMPMRIDRSKTKLGNFSYQALARLKPGVTIAEANRDLDRLLPVALRSFAAPDGFSANLFDKARISTASHPLKEDVVGDIGKVLWVLAGSIAMVLLVACANIANLLLVRVEGRRQELAIRAALGAGWRGVAGDLLCESMVLGVLGSIFGLVLAFVGIRVLVAVAPAGLPRIHEIGIDIPVLLFTLVLALLVSLLIGSIPIVRYTGRGLNASLREGGRAQSQSRERHRTRKALVILQVALALVLLICSGLMIQTFHALTKVSPGFTGGDTLQTFRFYIPETQVPEKEGERLVRVQQALVDKLSAIPGVSAVSFGNAVPLDGYDSNDVLYSQDRTYSNGEMPPIRRFKRIAPGFFRTLGTTMLTGRDITWSDIYGKRPVAVVSEGLARESWQTPQAALGKRIRVASTDDWREIVGVVADVRDDGIDKPAPASVYWPVLMDRFEGEKESQQRGVAFALRTDRAGSESLMQDVTNAAASVSPDVPLADVSTVGELYTKSMARTSFTLVLLSISGSMALLLGTLGIYGVIAYSVSQRTREIGIRMALGAQRATLTSMFLQQGLWLTGIGVFCGLVLAAVSMRLMQSLLFNVSPFDPVTYSFMTIGVVAIALLACYFPSRRASTVDPMLALRAE